MANGIITLDSSKSNLEGRVVWESEIDDIVENNSNVTARIQVRRNDGYTTQGTWSGAMRIGTVVKEFSLPSTYVGSSWVTMLEFSNIQTHADDGKGTCFIEAYCNAPSGTSLAGQSVSGSATVTLDTIPRTSSVTCADGNIGSATTININRASNTFTHTLKYTFGTLTGTIVTKTTETSYGWTIPTSFYAQIPNAKSGKGTITCETYSGSTLIGTSTCSFNALILEGSNKPTITATVVDTNATTTALTGDSNKLVKYFSNAKVTMTATAKNSATIASQKVTCGDGKSSTSATATLNAVESGTFNLTCTDSRGFVETNTVTKTMIDYIKLAITSLTIARESSTSNTVKITLKGNYFNSSFGSVSNTLTLKWRYRIQNGTWSGYTTVTATKSGNTFSYNGTLGTDFDYQQAYEFEIVAQDKLITDTKTQPVTAGIPLVDIWKDNVQINGNHRVSGEVIKNNGYSDVYRGIASSGSFNDYITQGYYNISDSGGNLTNAPYTGAHYGFLRIEVNTGTSWNKSSNWVWQSFKDTNKREYIRQAVNSGNFTNWTRKYNCYNLYNNTSGTTGTVTLNETSANFDYLEIFYGKAGGANLKSIRIYSPNGKSASLSIQWRIQQGSIQSQAQKANISGTSITREPEAYNNCYADGTIDGNDQQGVYIYRVDGYR